MLEDAIQLHRAGRLAEAEDGYRALLADHPDDAEVLHLLGLLRAQRGDVDAGLKLVTRAAELAPENAACRHTLGELYVNQGRLEEAAQAYEQARVLNPNLAAAYVGLGRVALLRGELDAAESHFRVALRADDNDVRALAGLGDVAMARGDSARALQRLAEAAELAPDNATTQITYAQALLDQGMLDFAEKALDNALATRPDFALARALRAEVHVRSGEITKALPILESLLARGELEGMVRMGLGDIACAEGRFEEAVAQYDEALRIEPGLVRAAVRRAETLARTGRVEQAVGDLRALAAVRGDDVKVHAALAQILAAASRHDEALDVWAAAEARWPDNVDLRARHALALDRAGRTEAALAKADEAARSPRPAIAMLRARGALLHGDPAAAVQRLQQIGPAELERRPPALAQRYHRMLGLAFDRLEQWPEAIDAFLRAQRATPANLPDLPALGAATCEFLRALGDEPPLIQGDGVAPVLICGVPGSGVARVAALLADQPGWFVRRDRFGTTPDFIAAPADPVLAGPLDQNALAGLARGYRAPLGRAAVPEGTRVADWIPVLDVRTVPAIKRALPGARLLLVAREPPDMLLDWLAFGWAQGFAMADSLSAARWMRSAITHLEQAARWLPVFRVDPDALMAPGGKSARRQLGEWLGLGDVVWGSQARGARTDARGLPICFPAGHADRYHAQLADAFAALVA